MQLLQSNTNTSSSYLRRLRSLGPDVKYKCVNFQDNEYIRFLNHLLAYEIGMKNLYQRLIRNQSHGVFEKCYENHKEACSKLRAIILTQHGIPDEEHSAFATDLSILVNQLGEQFGKTIAKKTHFKICLTMEGNIRNKFKEALERSPLTSRSEICALLFLSKSNLIALETARSSNQP